jgi:hypothetical protein
MSKYTSPVIVASTKKKGTVILPFIKPHACRKDLAHGPSFNECCIFFEALLPHNFSGLYIVNAASSHKFARLLYCYYWW